MLAVRSITPGLRQFNKEHASDVWQAEIIRRRATLMKKLTDTLEGQMSKTLIIIGLVLVMIGVLWPAITHLGLGSLPGDIRIERKGFSFYFLITTCIVISAVISIIWWLFRR